MTPRHLILVFNPAAGRGRGTALAEVVTATFEHFGHDVTPRPTRGPGHAADLVVEEIRSGGGRAIVVLGGDGTLNEAVAGAHRCGVLGSPAAPSFGVVPVGTANVIARELALPLQPVRAAAALAQGREVAMDVGICESSAGERPFLLSCGAGFEARAISLVSKPLKRRLGAVAYVVAGLRAMGHAVPLEIVATDATGAPIRLDGAIVAVGNARFYGGPCRLSRSASSHDGLLELVVARSERLALLLGAALRSRFGEAASAPGVRLVQVREATVLARAPVPVHVDAELHGTTPARVRVLPGAARLLAPPEAGEEPSVR